jgi:predicted transcriptional regulator
MEMQLTNRELDVMDALWTLGSGTVAEVREALQDELAYTTVLTVLRILHDKGFVRYEEEGRAHRYFPLLERQAAEKSALQHLTSKLFKGSPELLLTHLVSDEELDDADLRRLRALLDERLSEGEGCLRFGCSSPSSSRRGSPVGRRWRSALRCRQKRSACWAIAMPGSIGVPLGSP